MVPELRLGADLGGLAVAQRFVPEAADQKARRAGAMEAHQRTARRVRQFGDHMLARQPPERRRIHSDIERVAERSEEHTSELQSLMRTSYAVFCLKKKKKTILKTSVQ